MTKITRDTIITIGTGTQYEDVAAAAIVPGQALELIAAGTVQKKAAGLVKSENAFAIENYLLGGTIKEADAYASGEICVYRVFGAGDEVLAILKTNEDVAIGAKLCFGALGEVEAVGANTPVAVAVEALDASGVGAIDDRRIVIRLF